MVSKSENEVEKDRQHLERRGRGAQKPHRQGEVGGSALEDAHLPQTNQPKFEF